MGDESLDMNSSIEIGVDTDFYLCSIFIIYFSKVVLGFIVQFSYNKEELPPSSGSQLFPLYIDKSSHFSRLISREMATFRWLKI